MTSRADSAATSIVDAHQPHSSIIGFDYGALGSRQTKKSSVAVSTLEINTKKIKKLNAIDARFVRQVLLGKPVVLRSRLSFGFGALGGRTAGFIESPVGQ